MYQRGKYQSVVWRWVLPVFGELEVLVTVMVGLSMLVGAALVEPQGVMNWWAGFARDYWGSFETGVALTQVVGGVVTIFGVVMAAVIFGWFLRALYLLAFTDAHLNLTSKGQLATLYYLGLAYGSMMAFQNALEVEMTGWWGGLNQIVLLWLMLSAIIRLVVVRDLERGRDYSTLAQNFSEEQVSRFAVWMMLMVVPLVLGVLLFAGYEGWTLLMLGYFWSVGVLRIVEGGYRRLGVV